ncbi:hypothetical protein [Flavobacterium agrisoli]|uniref:Uncharacterized protein n=1 Tax=Flavobacterium agrisoli TaxID=2793066 RepID=A0A934PJ02_9FLAO|nr:hypothetical protein [Flavobacterium agrisoli]MBK0368527.1 hypothetical protein [Flavobacterium agrisoli]
MEVSGDTKKYLENCLSHYSEYVSVAKIIFPDAYKKMIQYDQKYKIQNYLSEYDDATKVNDIDLQISILKQGIKQGIYAPMIYERLSKAYEKKKNIESAYITCIAWFETDFWKLPNTANGSLRILKRLKRLEKKYHV